MRPGSNRELEVRYCSSVPRKPLPNGRMLVHNHIAHTKDMPASLQGFRFWTQKGWCFANVLGKV
jgi:hypothetical protein